MRPRAASRWLIAVPAEVAMVAQASRLDQISNREHGAEKDTCPSNHDICNTQEWVLAAHDSAR